MNFGTIVILGLVALFGLVLVLFFLLRSGNTGGEVEERMRTYATVPDYFQERKPGRTNPRLYRIRRQINSMLSVLGTEELNLQLMRADWKITATEYILIRLGVMLVGFALGWLFFGSVLSGLALAILANLMPGILLRRSASRRQIKFEGQLVDVLVLVYFKPWRLLKGKCSHLHQMNFEGSISRLVSEYPSLKHWTTSVCECKTRIWIWLLLR